MERFFSNPSDYERLYSCKYMTLDQWRAYGKPSQSIGWLYLGCGIFYLVIYLPFLIAMTQEPFLRHSCYKLMLFLGGLDILGIVFSAIIPGIWTLNGDVFCTNPNMSYIIGSLSTGTWAATCAMCITLAFNRAGDFIFPNHGPALFEGVRCFFWYAPPLLWGLYFILFSYPHVFTTRGYAFFFDPYFDIKNGIIENKNLAWSHHFHLVNNSITIITLPLIYAGICFFLCYSRNSQKIGSITIAAAPVTKTQKIIFIQCFLLCSITVTASTVYVVINYFSTPSWLQILGQLTWQLAHGSGGLIYLFLNQSLRQAVLRMFLPFLVNIPPRKTPKVSIVVSPAEESPPEKRLSFLKLYRKP